MKVGDNCVGCAYCMLVCKFEAIEVLGRAKVDESRCVKCLRCVDFCPVGAIKA